MSEQIHNYRINIPPPMKAYTSPRVGLVDAIAAAIVAARPVCKWMRLDDHSGQTTCCGQLSYIDIGQSFCGYCGGTLVESEGG